MNDIAWKRQSCESMTIAKHREFRLRPFLHIANMVYVYK